MPRLSPAAWLHIMVCFWADLSHLLNVSWWMGQDDGAEGIECLAILLKLLFNFVGSGDQATTFDLEKSFFSDYVVPVGASWHFHKLVLQKSSSLEFFKG